MTKQAIDVQRRWSFWTVRKEKDPLDPINWKGPKDWSGLNRADMALHVGLTFEYETFYRTASVQTHGNSSGMVSLVQQDTDGTLRVDVSPGISGLDEVLVTSAEFFDTVVAAWADVFQLPEDQLSRLQAIEGAAAHTSDVNDNTESGSI